MRVILVRVYCTYQLNTNAYNILPLSLSWDGISWQSRERKHQNHPQPNRTNVSWKPSAQIVLFTDTGVYIYI